MRPARPCVLKLARISGKTCHEHFPCEPAPPRARALLPATRYRSSGPLGALLSSPALDVRLLTALQVLQVPPVACEGAWL